MATVTLETIAQQCNVSRSAVSIVLRNPEHPRFAKATRDRIHAAAQKLNYVPNRMASGLRRGQSRLLGLVVPWNTPELLDRAEEEANKADFGMMIQFTLRRDPEAERRALALALERRVDGLVWLPADPLSHYGDLFQQIRDTDTHIVMLEWPVDGFPNADLVKLDYETSMRPVLRGLGQRYKKLVYVSRGMRHPMRAARSEIFKSAASDYDFPGEVIDDYDLGDLETLHRSCGRESTAFFCDADWFGLDVLQMANQRGLSIPDQVGVVSVSDLLIGGRYRIGEISNPSMSAIRRPSGTMVDRAVKLLVARVSGQRKGAGEVFEFPLSFHPRDSTLPLGDDGMSPPSTQPTPDLTL
jgi:LacI family transcriptional regulator